MKGADEHAHVYSARSVRDTPTLPKATIKLSRMSDEVRKPYTWRWQQWKQRQPANAKAPAAPVPPPLPPFVWDEAALIIAELTANVEQQAP